MRTHKLTRLKLIFHSIPMVGCWGIYFYGVYYLITRDTGTLRMIAVVIIAWTAALVIISLAWSAYMARLHKKYGPRSQVIDIKWDYQEDWLKYKADGNFSELKHAKFIVIACNHEAKIKFFVKDQ